MGLLGIEPANCSFAEHLDTLSPTSPVPSLMWLRGKEVVPGEGVW